MLFFCETVKNLKGLMTKMCGQFDPAGLVDDATTYIGPGLGNLRKML